VFRLPFGSERAVPRQSAHQSAEGRGLMLISLTRRAGPVTVSDVRALT